MDAPQTVKRVKTEYGQFLQRTRPDWTETQIQSHIADAFYFYKKSDSFWKLLESDATLAAAREEIRDDLTNETTATPPNRVDETVAQYCAALTALKEFVDVRGGVREYVGPEIDYETTIYQLAKSVCDGETPFDEAAAAMKRAVPHFSENSHKIYIAILDAMLRGVVYQRNAGACLLLHFIKRIGADYGREKMCAALRATQENVKYLYQFRGDRSGLLRRGCAKIAQNAGFDLRFDESLFAGIVPRQTPESDEVNSVRYWIYAAGDGSVNWESDYADGLTAIGWPELGDLAAYETKDAIRQKMREIHGGNKSYKNQILATWQFANELKPGDVVFVKKGRQTIVGRGIVDGDYVYDESRGHYCNLRAVRWTDKGEWSLPPGDSAPMKTLTDVTPYGDLVEKLQALFDADRSESELLDAVEQETFDYEPYSEDDFLNEVYLDAASYARLKYLLLTKKNVILQGAPGVGKTFAAKRLAYSIMGEKDASRVTTTQLHQSYSYEDFLVPTLNFPYSAAA